MTTPKKMSAVAGVPHVRHPLLNSARGSSTSRARRSVLAATRCRYGRSRARGATTVLASSRDSDAELISISIGSGRSADRRDRDDSTLAKLDSVLGTEEEEEEEEKKPATASIAASAPGRGDGVTAGVGVEEEVGKDGNKKNPNPPPSSGWWAVLAQDSSVYNVPLYAPRAAWALAAVHVAVFAGDYFLYKMGSGSGGAWGTKNAL
jgi:hypothetical protein